MFSWLFRLVAFQLMSERCNKCRGSRRAENNTWCLGCLSWESLEKELTGSWHGPAGLRVIAENLVLGTAREVRALRAFGAGLGLASGGSAGSSSGGLRAPGIKEELPEGATPKKKPPGGDKEASEEYEYEESEEEEPQEKDQVARPVSPAPVDTRSTLPRRSRVPESEVSTRREEESRGHLESSHKKRSRSRRRREESKDKRREEDPERKKDRRDPGEREPDRRERPE